MVSDVRAGAPINSYALVSYLPPPLAAFLDALRAELDPFVRSKAHVTVLPPRPIFCSTEQALGDLTSRLEGFAPFRVELDEVRVFPLTDVIYISVSAGRAELETFHSALAQGELAFEEPFEYHPHITLAQELNPEQVTGAAHIAGLRWKEYSDARSFLVDRLTFVQNTLGNRWLDLARLDLAG